MVDLHVFNGVSILDYNSN